MFGSCFCSHFKRFECRSGENGLQEFKLVDHPIDIDISTLETRMKNYTLKRIDEQMGWPWRDNMLGIRKIKIQTELDLSEVLKKVRTYHGMSIIEYIYVIFFVLLKMGITEIFAAQSNSSDFPNSNGKKIKIEKMIHKVEFDFTQQHLGYWSKREFSDIFAIQYQLTTILPIPRS